MAFKYVPEGDILIICVREGERAQTVEPHDEVFVDVDAAGRALAIEIVGAHGLPSDALIQLLERFGLVVAPKDLVHAA